MRSVMCHAPYVLTLIADRAATALSPTLVARVREAVQAQSLTVLSPGEAADLIVATDPDPALVREALNGAAIDALVQPATGRRKRLLIADMDSTIVTGETLDELADFAGLKARVAAITARAMNGELDFKEALRERVGLLKGLPLAALEQTWARVRLTAGAAELVATMRAQGAVAALVSSGFTFFTGRVATILGFDLHRSNRLLDDGEVLTGEVAEPIRDRHDKVRTLREQAGRAGIGLEATLAVGDGANDLDMLELAGLGVAYHAKPVVAAAARARVDHANLRALLFAQGYDVREFRGV
jgi:phosphoserine phosphatase